MKKILKGVRLFLTEGGRTRQKGCATLGEYLVDSEDLKKVHEVCGSPHLSCMRALPRVSFVIPTFNSEMTLEKCLASIRNQEYPDIEIVVVDGYSKDNSVQIARRYTDKIIFDHGTYGQACQVGAENCTGEVLGLFDSDIIIPHKDWLKNAVDLFQCDNKISTIWPVNTAPPNGSLTTRWYFNFWKIFMEDRIKKGKGYFGGGNSLFLKKCLENIGGVSKEMHWGADFDWAKKLNNRGYKVVFLKDPIYHDTMKTVQEFARKQFTGAKTFTKTGFGLMGLSNRDIFYEHSMLGTKGMLVGLFKKREKSWIYHPLFVCVRVFAYSGVHLANAVEAINKGWNKHSSHSRAKNVL